MKKIKFKDSVGNTRQGWIVFTSHSGVHLVYEAQSENYYAGFALVREGLSRDSEMIAVSSPARFKKLKTNISLLEFDGFKDSPESVMQEFGVGPYCAGSPTDKLVQEIIRLRNAQEED